MHYTHTDTYTGTYKICMGEGRERRGMPGSEGERGEGEREGTQRYVRIIMLTALIYMHNEYLQIYTSSTCARG